MDEGSIRERIRLELDGTRIDLRPDPSNVMGRAQRLRVRKLLVGGAVGIVVAGAIVVPLTLMSRVGGHSAPPSGPSVSAPHRAAVPAERGLLLVNLVTVEGARQYFEGAFRYLRVETHAGRLVAEREFRQGDPPADPDLRLPLLPGHYALVQYDRPCSAACPQLDPDTSGRCSRQFGVRAEIKVEATIRLSDPACTISFVMEPTAKPVEPIPRVAEVVCDDSGTHLLTPQVVPQPDGLHVLEHRQDGRPVFYEHRPEALSFSMVGGSDSDVEVVYPLPPGDNRLVCAGGGRDPGDASLYISLMVVDEAGLWVSPLLSCGASDIAYRGFVDYAIPPEGEAGDPVELVRKYLRGLREDDVVERAGYPEAEKPAVRVVRQRRVIAQIQLVENPFLEEPRGRWIFDIPAGFAFCSSQVDGFGGDTPLG